MIRRRSRQLAMLAAGSVIVGASLLGILAVRAQDPDETVAELARKGEAAYRSQDWKACAEHFAAASRAVEAGVHSNASYNAACCYALAGEFDDAFDELTRSIDAGYNDPDHLGQDTDLNALHDDPRWAELLARLAANRDAYLETVNVELLEIYEADQADRHGDIDWTAVAPRDEQRREWVTEIMAAGGAEVADDYFHAAMVFQHGSEPDDVKQAREWALRAVELDPEHDDARWLAAAAEDRYLMYLEKPQKYGTQFRKIDGRWVLWEVDPSITDEERARWKVPPLAEAQARAEAMNQD